MEEDQTSYSIHKDPVRLAFKVSYLGDYFYGSQIQDSLRTVEGEIISACLSLNLFSDWRRAGFCSSGRTDKGVHSRAQIIAFTTDLPHRALTALNRVLPRDCWCTGYSHVPPSFHPRYDTKTRTYRYFFSPGDLDLTSMSEASQIFMGRHNFTNLSRVCGKNPYRSILTICLGCESDLAYIEVTAESFLWNQVRCMASVLFSIGRGDLTERDLMSLLTSEGEHKVHPAPPEGLVFWEADTGLEWIPLPQSQNQSHYLDNQISHHHLMEKITLLLR